MKLRKKEDRENTPLRSVRKTKFQFECVIGIIK
jgi:hypothetical protein